MTSAEFSWDSFSAKELEGVAKDTKHSGGDSKRRHDDLPRYNAPTDGNRKSRGAPFNNRNNQGRVSESKNQHDDRVNSNRNGGRGGEQFNRQPTQRKPRTASDSYDDRDHRSGAPNPKSNPPKGQNRQFRNNNNGANHQQNHRDNQNGDGKHRHAQVNGKSEKESNTERELRQQIMRMKGHMLYLKDQNAYKDQVIHHKDQVILALRAKLEKLKAGSSETTEASSAPIEPPKPVDLDKMEQDLATEDVKAESPVNSEEEKKENFELESCAKAESEETEKTGESSTPAEEEKKSEDVASTADEKHDHGESDVKANEETADEAKPATESN